MDAFKLQLKPLYEEYERLLEEISIKKERVKNGKLFDLIDWDDNVMTTYDERGEFMESRRLKPEEKKGQSRMFVPEGLKPVDKTGTGNDTN